MNFFKEILFTIKTRQHRGNLSLWEYHICRQYKKYVFSKVKPDNSDVVLVQCDGFISEMEILNSEKADIERHKKYIVNHMACQMGEHMWEKGLISVTQEKAHNLDGLRFVAKVYCVKREIK